MPKPHPDSSTVKAARADISTQISSAIAEGFQVVLQQERSQRAEADASMRDMARNLRMIHDILDQQARAAGAGLPGAGVPASVASARAREANAASRRILDAQKDLPPASLVNRLDQGQRPEPPEPFSMERQMKQTREGIRQSIYNRVIGGTNDWAYSPFGGRNGIIDNPHGGVSRILPNAHFADGSDQRTAIEGIHYDSAGRLRDVHGKYVPQHVVQALSEKEMAQLTRRQAMARTAGQVADMWRSGEPIGRSLMSVLPEGTLKTLGVAGMAYTAGMQGLEAIQGQVKAQRQFQEYYGGNLTDNLGDRFDQWVNTNVTGRFSPFGSEAYGSLFNAAMRHGLRGGGRSDFISQGSKIYSQGVSIEQTTKLLEIALAASHSLDGLANSISGINKAARAAKVSAVEAREIFTKNYEASSQALFGQGASAQSLASTLTVSSVRLGESYASSVDYTGITSRTQNYVNASRLGLDIGDYQRGLAENPNLGVIASSMGIKQMLSNYVGTQGLSIQQVIDQYRSTLNGRRINADDLDAIGQALLNAGYDGGVLAEMLSRSGVQTDAIHAPGIAASYFLGLDPGSEAARQQEASRTNLTGNAFNASSTAVQILASDNSVAPSQFSEKYGTSQAWDQTLIDAYVKYDGATDTNVFTHSMSKVEQELLKDPSKYGISPDSKVAVQTADGRRVVKFSDALKFFSDQIANGTAMFIDGNENVQNKTVAQVLSLGSEFTTQAAASATDSSVTSVGESYSGYTAKASEESANESTDNLVIDLSPEAKQLLNMLLNGSPYAGGPTQ